VTWINIRYGWRALFWAGFLALLAALLDFLPLFNVLGYDFSFALGLATALAGVDIGHGTVRVARASLRTESVPRLAGEAIVTTLAALVAPLLISLANALRVRNCNLGAGLTFFALLPVGTAIYAAGVGVAVGLVVPGRRLGRMAAWALPFLSIAWALVRLYRDPAVFAFDPFGGYFPGPIYDEALRPPLRLVWYRMANLTWLAALLATMTWLCGEPRPENDDEESPSVGFPRPSWQSLAHPPGWRTPLWACALLVAGTVWFAARGRLGFHVTHSDLLHLLPRETRSQHFVLRTDSTAENEADVALAVKDLEFRYDQLTEILGVEPTIPITVYRFPSAAAKKDAVGAANTLYAKPWTREIFVQADRFPAGRLRHELAHVFASAFGDRLFGVAMAWHFAGPLPVPSLATGLIEGVAEAADFDDPDGRSTTHQEAAAMIALGQAPDLRRALGAGFTFESGPRAYTVAGSFCRFLLEGFGAAKLRALYRSAGDFNRVYGRDLDSLEQDWRAFLASLPVDEDNRAQAEERFRRPAIFQKVCARELAARVSDARTRMATSPADAVALLSSACADDPSEPSFELDLAEALASAGDDKRALFTLTQALASGTLTRPLRGRAANLEAAVHFRAGRLDQARAALDQALLAASDDSEERSAKAKLRALRDDAAQKTLGHVFFGDERGRALDPGLVVYLVTEFARESPDEALGPYLVGRQLAPRDPRLAVAQLSLACPLDDTRMEVPLDATFLKECRRLLGESAFLAGDLELARAAYAWIFEHARHEADRLRARDFLQRIAWQASH
jgi:tetratricopeptide (TPR) repeat protein